MRTPTGEQLAVLTNSARIRVVRAAPGSGKTWVVAEVIWQELEGWTTTGSGIAALSFTRVGGEEIRNAVGYEIGHPHFVGTLDAFLFRYVVRPFLRKVHPEWAPPRLLPADWLPGYWSKGPGGTQLTVARPGSRVPFKILDACFVGEEGNSCVIGYPAPRRSELERLGVQASASILHAKRQLWAKLGWLTHSDAAFLAAQVLGDPGKGSVIVAELVRRFPFVIVDELQDTGWFLGRAIETMLASKFVRALLVGDPDQAIYEFNGARPDLFDRFTNLPDAIELSLSRTQRCSAAVCRVAEALSQSRRTIQEVPHSAGRAILLTYDDLQTDIAKVRERLQSDDTTVIVKLVARHRSTIEAMTGRRAASVPALGSPPLNHMHRAVDEYRLGRQARALACARAALELAIFDEQGIAEERLSCAGIDPSIWKRTAVECLLAANHEVIGENLFDWGCRTADDIRHRIGQLVAKTGAQIAIPSVKRPYEKHQASQRDRFLFRPTPVAQTVTALTPQTVHSVKGETHDLTIFVCPPANRASRCPSQIWWPGDPTNLEEQRIAFVAVTRSRGHLILCIPQASLDRLTARGESRFLTEWA
jgi:DNA helicase-2/ATP-dependent DNA helicase PcrA